MALESRLDLRLTQKLILTPQLQQAIKLLQMPQLELAQVINQELTENPFLEEISEEAEIEVYPKEEETVTPDYNENAELSAEDFVKFSVDEYFEERSSDGRDLGYFTPGTEEKPSYDIFYSKKPGLSDHLLWQLRLSNSADDVRKVAETVIGNIDEHGYLRATDEELAAASEVSIETVKAAIELVQSFDPPGVGARNLQECLLLQLSSLNLGGTLVEKIVINNMEDLQKKRYSNIAKQHNVSQEDVITAVRIIEGLEPRPAISISGEEVNYIAPDVYINKIDGGYQIILNDEGMPRLGLNSNYRKLLFKKEMLTKEERGFLKEKLRQATELIKSLDQRNRTIYKVSDSILKFQIEFFEKGMQYLKPLNLKDIASDILMHESTISRVTSNKFLACSHGVFSFRFFFSSALQSEGGEVSSTIVKDSIRKIISEEDHKKPLSDNTIADKLREQNVNIARRTVAKYREELKIPPQNMRKKYD
ncbi:MAG: RNA polymerase sigma-54 factor [Thermodesulfovibrio sp.]|nr:RNA polymerase sigma-54 factor [Thermodesulfovibrio sp.]